jgi:hypothetical protein
MGGCTNCKGKSGCDHRKGEMLEAVADALDRLYPTRTWGERVDVSAAPRLDGLAALADELATELDAATFVVPGGPDATCDYIYVLCVGRPPCAVQVRDAGVPAPAEWDGAAIQETYLRVCVSHVAPFAAVQEIAIDVAAEAGGYVIRERPRAGVYSAPLLRRMQRLVAILPAYDLVHLDFGEIAAPPPGFAAGAWTSLYGGAPAVANYLFSAEPATMVTTAWLPREAGAHAC